MGSEKDLLGPYKHYRAEGKRIKCSSSSVVFYVYLVCGFFSCSTRFFARVFLFGFVFQHVVF